MTAHCTAVLVAVFVPNGARSSAARSHGMRQPAWTRAISQTISSAKEKWAICLFCPSPRCWWSERSHESRPAAACRVSARRSGTHQSQRAPRAARLSNTQSSACSCWWCRIKLSPLLCFIALLITASFCLRPLSLVCVRPRAHVSGTSVILWQLITRNFMWGVLSGEPDKTARLVLLHRCGMGPQIRRARFSLTLTERYTHDEDLDEAEA